MSRVFRYAEDLEQQNHGATALSVQQQTVPQPQPEAGGTPSDRPWLQDVLWNAGAGGVVDAINSTTDFAHGVGSWATEKLGVDEAIGFDHEGHKLRLPEIAKPETGTGQFVRPVINFLSAFAGAGKLKIVKKIGGPIKRGFVKGAIADGVGMDPNEGLLVETLHDLVAEKPEFQGPLLDYMAETDRSQAERRLIRTIEGMGLGVATEGVFHAFRAFKALRAGSKEEANHALKEAVEKADLILATPEQSLTGQVIRTAGDTPAQVPLVAPKAADAGIAPEVMDQVKDKVRDYLTGNKTIHNFDLEDFKGVLNYHRHGSTDQNAGMFEAVLRVVKDSWDDGVIPVKQYDTMGRELANLYGTDINTVTRQLGLDSVDVREATYRFHAAKLMADSTATDIGTTARKLVNNFNDRDAVKFLDEIEGKLEGLAMVSSNIKNFQKEIARSLSSMRNITKGMELSQADAQALAELLEQTGGRANMQRYLTQLASYDSAEQVVRHLNKMGSSRNFWDVHNTFYINNLLSGFKTHTVNVLTSALKTAVMPMETMLGGVAQGAATGNFQAVRHGAKLYVGLATHAWESLKLAGRAIRQGGGILDPGNYKHDIPGAENALKGGMVNESETLLQHGMNFLSTMVKMPTRLMAGEDEFFKQLNYRAKAFADLYDKAVESGVGRGLKGKAYKQAVDDFISKNMDQLIDPETGRALHKGHIQYARQSTFTNDLKENWPGRAGGKLSGDPLSAGLQRFVNDHPYLRLVFPFIRTPANLIRDTMKRMPLAGTNQYQWRHAYEQGGIQQAEAIGQQVLGSMVWISAISLALSGRITHGGSTNRDEYRVWRMGETPYSIVTDDGKRININRAAPFSLPFTMAADFVYLAPHMTDNEMESAAGSMMKIMSRYVSSQTYLTGLVGVIDALHHSDQYADIFVRQLTGNYVPYSTFFNQLRQGIDPHYREVESIMTHVQNRIPGLSESLPIKYNWLTGQPVESPPGYQWMDGVPGAILEKTSKMMSPYPIEDRGDQSFVLEELKGLQIGLAAPERKIQGVELNAAQYSEYNRLIGNIKLRGRTLMEQLAYIMEHPRYDLERKQKGDPKGELLRESFRHDMVRDTVNQYKTAARNELIKRDPELQEMWKRRQEIDIILKRPARSSGPSQIDQIIN